VHRSTLALLLVRWCGRGAALALGVWWVREARQEGWQEDERTTIVANHVSHLDLLLLAWRWPLTAAVMLDREQHVLLP